LEEIEPRNTLPKGFILNEYQIECVLGKPGGFGVTYLAQHIHLKQKVAIKEYLPTDFAVREGRNTVYPRSGSDENDFKWGLERFLQEAQALARFSHPNIVRVLYYFEANHTAYMVMEYQEGECFADYLRQGTLSEEELLGIIVPLLSGLEEIHKANLLHRDIKPNNIYVRKDGTPVLLDFGSARYEVTQKSRSVTTIVTPGYAPLEQYDNEIKEQGAWTDIYALGAVMYRVVSGEVPPAATRRVMKDPLVPALEIGKGKYSEKLLKAIDWALQISREDRPKNVVEWRKTFVSEGNLSQTISPPLSPSPVGKFLNSPKSRWLCFTLLGGASVLLLLAVVMGISLFYHKNARQIETSLAEQTQKIQALTTQLNDIEKKWKEEKENRKRKEEILKKIELFHNIQEDNNELAKLSEQRNKYYDVVGVKATDVLHVRQFPSHLAYETGQIPPNGHCVVYLGKLRVIGDKSIWILIEYKDETSVITGWVNSQYLIASKVDCH